MEKLLSEIKQLITFKDTTDVGDVVLIVAEKPQMLVYAVVLKITRDSQRKDEWWHIDFLFLSIPPQKTTWTLRTEQMTGREIFTMGGEERFVKAIEIPQNTHSNTNKKLSKSSKKPVLRRIK